jgi:hypothetical protein
VDSGPFAWWKGPDDSFARAEGEALPIATLSFIRPFTTHDFNRMTDPELFVDPARSLMSPVVRLGLGLMRVTEFLRMRPDAGRSVPGAEGRLST